MAAIAPNVRRVERCPCKRSIITSAGRLRGAATTVNVRYVDKACSIETTPRVARGTLSYATRLADSDATSGPAGSGGGSAATRTPHLPTLGHQSTPLPPPP